jgi:hypothetical protein
VVAQTISHYGLWISIGLVVVIVFFQVRSQRRMMRVYVEGRAVRAEAQALADANTLADAEASADGAVPGGDQATT